MRKAKLLLPLAGILLILVSCGRANDWKNTPSVKEETESTVSAVHIEEKEMKSGFDKFTNVTISGVDLSSLNEEEQQILYRQAEYCQAMTEADTDTMRSIVSEDMVFTHMSGKQQNREEYFADIADGSLTYYTIGIENPVIRADDDHAEITFTSVLNANAYGARGTFRMKGTHAYEKRDGVWIAVNRPE